MIVARFADDFVVGFEHRDDAERFWAELRERFASFGLELHEGKTRLIEFGRFAAQHRARRGDPKPETFDFLGFTHICAKDRRGRFKLRRVTSKKRMRTKLHAVKTEMRRRMHHPIPEQGRWLASVLQGHYNYYAVPDNSRGAQQLPSTGQPALAPLASASQPATPDDLGADRAPRRSMATSPPHPAPLAQPSLRRQNPRQEPSALDAHAEDLCGGRRATGVPTGAPGMTSSSGVQVPCGGDDTNHKPRATASS